MSTAVQGSTSSGRASTLGATWSVATKVTIGAADRDLDALFARLTAAIGETNSLSADEKRDLAAKGDELRAELEQPEPDLGKVARLKERLQARGGQIASVVGMIFHYPPVQETLKTLTQRLLGA